MVPKPDIYNLTEIMTKNTIIFTVKISLNIFPPMHDSFVPLFSAKKKKKIHKVVHIL